MTRIDDVARLAGVSTATVSRALRGLPTVSQATRQRVLDAAQELGYRVSPHASRLAGGRAGAVAAVVPRITRWFFATVVEAAEEEFHRAGHDLLLYNLSGRAEERARVLHTATLRARADAIMLVATPLTTEEVRAVAGLGLPGVTVSSGTQVPDWPRIRIDDVAAARTATEHLLHLGHTRIAHISGDPAGELSFTTHLYRRRGFHEALHDAGLTAAPDHDVPGGFTVAGGARAAATLLRLDRRPTAIFAASDEMAMGALATLRAAGVRVPQDMSVIGLDDHDLAATVGLTTVAQPAAEQGRIAAVSLLRQLDADRGGSPDEVVLPTQLIVRDSTGAPPSRDLVAKQSSRLRKFRRP